LGTFPLADLEKWLAFYREQQARYPAHAITYEPDSVVLAEEVRTVGTLP
jgi:hypothetical protein